MTSNENSMIEECFEDSLGIFSESFIENEVIPQSFNTSFLNLKKEENLITQCDNLSVHNNYLSNFNENSLKSSSDFYQKVETDGTNVKHTNLGIFCSQINTVQETICNTSHINIQDNFLLNDKDLTNSMTYLNTEIKIKKKIFSDNDSDYNNELIASDDNYLKNTNLEASCNQINTVPETLTNISQINIQDKILTSNNELKNSLTHAENKKQILSDKDLDINKKLIALGKQISRDLVSNIYEESYRDTGIIPESINNILKINNSYSSSLPIYNLSLNSSQVNTISDSLIEAIPDTHDELFMDETLNNKSKILDNNFFENKSYFEQMLMVKVDPKALELKTKNITLKDSVEEQIHENNKVLISKGLHKSLHRRSRILSLKSRKSTNIKKIHTKRRVSMCCEMIDNINDDYNKDEIENLNINKLNDDELFSEVLETYDIKINKNKTDNTDITIINSKNNNDNYPIEIPSKQVLPKLKNESNIKSNKYNITSSDDDDDDQLFEEFLAKTKKSQNSKKCSNVSINDFIDDNSLCEDNISSNSLDKLKKESYFIDKYNDEINKSVKIINSNFNQRCIITKGEYIARQEDSHNEVPKKKIVNSLEDTVNNNISFDDYVKSINKKLFRSEGQYSSSNKNNKDQTNKVFMNNKDSKKKKVTLDKGQHIEKKTSSTQEGSYNRENSNNKENIASNNKFNINIDNIEKSSNTSLLTYYTALSRTESINNKTYLSSDSEFSDMVFMDTRSEQSFIGRTVLIEKKNEKCIDDISKKLSHLKFPSTNENIHYNDFKTPANIKVHKSKIIPQTFPRPKSSFSFIKSLDKNIANDKRDPQAIKYITNFSKTKKALVLELFEIYNRDVFMQKLSLTKEILWNKRLTKTAGYCAYTRLCTSSTDSSIENKRTFRIELSSKICDSADRVRDTLIHELCHAYVWVEYGVRDGHGEKWKFWARRANLQLTDLPPINRCHTYSINSKYIYKCQNCGYEIKRFSKSIDVDLVKCKFCSNQLVLLLSAKTESNLNTPNNCISYNRECPDTINTKKLFNSQYNLSAKVNTPIKTPTAYNLFVKEHFASIKKNTPGISYGDIMKKMGSMYSVHKNVKRNINFKDTSSSEF